MPILMDYSQVVLATLFVTLGNHTSNTEISEDLLRHMFLNSLRANRKKFAAEYGELVICCDSKNPWRKSIFPQYKAGRAEGRKKSGINWTEVFRSIEVIRTELDEFFPYKVIKVDEAEADDIIGTICHKHGTVLNTGTDKILVLSGDKDYIQLQKYANVTQYNPALKKYVTHADPEFFLKEQIFRGDAGDGVPNILSEDDVFVKGERQRMLTSKRFHSYLESMDNMDEQTKIRYFRNKMLIDLSETPKRIKDEILTQYEVEKTVGRNQLFNYFVNKKLKNLISNLQDF